MPWASAVALSSCHSGAGKRAPCRTKVAEIGALRSLKLTGAGSREKVSSQ